MKLSKGGTLPLSKPLKPFDGTHGLCLPAKGEKMWLRPRSLILNKAEVEWLLRRSDEELQEHGMNREQLIKLYEPS